MTTVAKTPITHSNFAIPAMNQALDTPKLRVMQILPALNSGGVEKGTLELNLALVALGHTSLVVSSGGRLVAELEADGGEHISLPVEKKSLSAIWQIGKLAKIIEHYQPDIVHVRSRLPAWITHFALKKLSKQGQHPIHVSTVHGFNSVSKYSEIMTRADKVIVVSQSIGDYVLANYPSCPRERLALIYRGIEPKDWPYGYQPTTEWLHKTYQEFPQLQGKRWLTLVGRVSELKGHEWLVKALAELRTKAPNQYNDLQLVIIGANKETQSGYVTKLTEQIKQLGLADHVTFTGDRRDIADWLAASTISFNLSKKPESFGRTTLEALSLGVTVIAWDKGGVSEILTELYPAGKVPDSDLIGLVATIEQQLNTPSKPYHAYPFTLQAMTDQTLALYQQLMAESQQAKR